MLLGACRGRRARWAGGGLLAASLSKAPINRAVCNWVEAHTPRAGAAWANGFRQPQRSSCRQPPGLWAAAPSPAHPAAAGGLFGSEGCGGAGPAGYWRRRLGHLGNRAMCSRADRRGGMAHSQLAARAVLCRRAGAEAAELPRGHRVPELLLMASASHRARWAGPAGCWRRATRMGAQGGRVSSPRAAKPWRGRSGRGASTAPAPRH